MSCGCRNLTRTTWKVMKSDEWRSFPYIVGQRAEIFHEGKWQQGCIVAGYRFRDGIVTIQTDAGQQLWCGESRKELYRKI